MWPYLYSDSPRAVCGRVHTCCTERRVEGRTPGGEGRAVEGRAPGGFTAGMDSWPLNNAGLNCTGPPTRRFFNKYRAALQMRSLFLMTFFITFPLCQRTVLWDAVHDTGTKHVASLTKNTACHTWSVQRMCEPLFMLSVRLPVNSGLLAIKLFGRSQSSLWIFVHRVRGQGPWPPRRSRVHCTCVLSA